MGEGCGSGVAVVSWMRAVGAGRGSQLGEGCGSGGPVVSWVRAVGAGGR